MGVMHDKFAEWRPASEAQANHYDEADQIADETLRRRSADKFSPPPVASRADKIVAEGDAKRVAYRNAHPGADAAMVFGAQVGHLHAEIRRLCNELDRIGDQVLERHEAALRRDAEIGACRAEDGR